MATVAHCLYCFDALAANLEKHESLSLSQVQDWWSRYNSKGEVTGVQNNREREENNTVLENGADSEDGDDDPLEEVDSDEDQIVAPVPRSDLRLPTISRLQNASPSTASTSSTPSLLLTPSSQAALSNTSKSSSSSSFFSFSRRSASSPVRKEEHPLFVTWNTLSSLGRKSLRGCIGTFDPLELAGGLRSYALTAAFDDTRFSPITRSELPSLSTSVTLLTAFTPASDPFDWTLGTHGLRISFTHHGKRYGATYLPDVAVEQGWTKEETLLSLMRKAGWCGRSGEWKKVGDLRVVRYQGKKESVDYSEWKEWREWVKKEEKREGVM